VAERFHEDADWATAAEQSSEDDEAQEGSVLASQQRSSEPAEHSALHVEEEEADPDADADDETYDIEDP
jgi:transcriptional antiterminator NusG